MPPLVIETGISITVNPLEIQEPTKNSYELKNLLGAERTQKSFKSNFGADHMRPLCKVQQNGKEDIDAEEYDDFEVVDTREPLHRML